MGAYDWRLSERNVWKVERMLLDTQHQPLRMPDARFRDFRTRYRAFKEQYPDRKPLFYEGRETWTPIPKEFLGALGAPKRAGAKRAGMMILWLRRIRHDFNPSAKSPAPAVAPSLVIDLNLGRIISHSEPSSGSTSSSPTPQRILADEKARREAAFEQSFNTERTKGDALSKRFEEALKQAKEEPITKPTRDFDLD